MDLVKVRFELTGSSGSSLLMKNPQMADPLLPVVKEIKTIDALHASKKTDEHLHTKFRLQWKGSLYLDEQNRIAIPARNILACAREAARITKEGPKIERGLNFTDMFFPLSYEGPQDLDKLYADDSFSYRTMVNSNPSSGKKSMVPAVRPHFTKWAVVADALIQTDILGFDTLERTMHLAGASVGLGDNRRNGFGRFQAVVSQV